MSRTLDSVVLLVCLGACAAPAPRPPLVEVPLPPQAARLVPMPGEPDDAALAEVRLTETTCTDVEAERSALVEERVQEMHARIARNRTEWTREAGEKCAVSAWGDPLTARGQVWGDTIGESFGAGGLGLSGTGDGGGGVGQGAGVSPVEHARSSSKTNNQVEGVDEADLVKHDGAYLYLATGTSLRIVRANPPELIATVPLPGTARQLFVEGDRVVAYVAQGDPQSSPCTYAYDCTVAGDGTHTRIVVLDVADRAHPRIARELQLSGSLIAARRIGNAVHTVVADQRDDGPGYALRPRSLPWCGVPAKKRAALEKAWERLEAENEQVLRSTVGTFPTLAEGSAVKTLCSVLRTRAGGNSFTTLMSFDLTADAKKPVTATMRSKPGIVFASEHTLYLAVHEPGQAKKEQTDLHAFHIGPHVEATRYAGSGVVPGHVLNQLAMDERAGVLRVATTSGRVPDPDVESAVSSFVQTARGNLIRVGAVSQLARGEDIRAVRFDGDRGYVVTFKKTDPLFVLDLNDAAAPKVLGELKIPGFSTYLHRIDPDHLLSIGFDADDHGDFAFYGGILLQLFDVHDPLHPKLLHRQALGSRGSSSEAAGDHLAFNYMPERNLLAIPATLCKGGGDGRYGTELSFSGLMVFEASATKGFTQLGGVDHGRAGARCDTWWSNPTSLVQRSVVLDDLVYSIAPDRMNVQNLKHLGSAIASIPLGG